MRVGKRLHLAYNYVSEHTDGQSPLPALHLLIPKPGLLPPYHSVFYKQYLEGKDKSLRNLFKKSSSFFYRMLGYFS